MAKPKDLPPLSEAARLDQQIAERMRVVANGGDVDMSEVSSLIRRRVDASLPKALVARRAARVAG